MNFKEFLAKYGELWNFMQELKILYPTRPKLRILKGFGWVHVNISKPVMVSFLFVKYPNLIRLCI